MASLKKVYDFDPRNLPEDVLAAIGLAVACSSQTQYMVEAAIWGCLGLDAEYGMAVTTHMPNPLRISTLKAAAEIKIDAPELLDELDKLLDSVEKALKSRNDYSHQSWAIDHETGEVFTAKISARGSVTADLLLQSVSKIKIEAFAIYDAGMALRMFLDRNNLVPPNPTLRPRGHKTKAARKKRGN